jgi:SPP1 gp7 family putative phage head morphogenesis protein
MDDAWMAAPLQPWEIENEVYAHHYDGAIASLDEPRLSHQEVMDILNGLRADADDFTLRGIYDPEVSALYAPYQVTEEVIKRQQAEIERIKQAEKDVAAMPRRVGTPPEPPYVTEDAIREQAEWIKRMVHEIFDEDALKDALQKLASRLDGATLRQIGKNLGIDLYADVPSLAASIDDWVLNNVAIINAVLIDTVEDATRKALVDDIADVVIDAWRRGVTGTDLAKSIEERLDVSSKRARFIARDQISTLNGQVVHERQSQAGITRYRWSTSRDERVRPEHRRLNNTVQRWDTPPDVGGGRKEHPGGDYQCRCVAVPIMPEWMSK